ncbi:NAD(P)-dependent oxidoreductase [Patescibacteria group bacterium]|nr:NAD(P)-dependent oxidoreductase [Patescibacteria group bacterium]
MKVFITGSSGFIGEELVKHLSGEHEIVEYDLENDQDILDYEKLKKAMGGCDVVVHLAAIRGPDETKIFPNYFDINCKGVLNVVKAAVENDVKRIVYSSSTGYYGLERGVTYVEPIREPNSVITQHLKADDMDCRDCDVAYSTSKVIAEQILANYGLRKKIEVIILRLGPIGNKQRETFGVDGITLKIVGAVQAIEKAMTTKKEMWYEAFTITDKSDKVDLSKAEKLLGYEPN